MISSKDVLLQFKSASWKAPEEAAQLAGASEGVTSADLLKMLELLSGRQGEPQAQRLRLVAFGKLNEKFGDKSLFVPYVRALPKVDGPVRSALAAALLRINSPTEHGELCGLLRASDPAVRQLGGKILAQLNGSRSAFETLTKAVGEPQFPGRLEAMDALVAFAKAQAIPALQTVLGVGAVPERVAAAKLLGDARVAGKDPALPLKALVPALDPATPEAVLCQVIQSFGALCGEEDYWEFLARFLDSESINVVRAAVEALKRFRSPRAIAALERKLRAGPRVVRLAVLSVLETIGTDEVLPPLVEALGHRQIPVRTRAAEVMRQLSLAGKLDLIRTVVWLLRSPQVEVRRMASELVRSVSDPDQSLWPKLLSLLREEDWWVRERVMDALIEMGGTQLTRHMLVYLADPSDVVRRFAVTVLSRLKDPKALRALVEVAQKDGDWWVRETAVEAIAAINDARAIPYVARMLADEPLQIVALQALIDMKATAAVPQVLSLLTSANPDVRFQAICALDALGGSEHSETVAPLLDDPSASIRKRVRELLQRWQFTAAGEKGRANLSALDRMLVALCEAEGDDLILAAERVPAIKRVGQVTPLAEEPIAADTLQSMLAPHLTPEQLLSLQAQKDVDFSYEVKAEGLRFRVNVFTQMTGPSAVFRRIKGRLPRIEELGVPDVVKTLGELKNGLVLVGGPTGSGKSTTLAAIIDSINRNSARHIMCLEDPIEVLHPRHKSLINQREIGTHTRSFHAALRSTLRQDPNVILVGELRDLETIAFAVVAAETGHLVFGTVHTVSVATSVDRLISAFPAAEQEQVRSTLAETLRAVVCQYLLKEKDGDGRVLAVEVMLNNEAIANLIRKGKAFQIPSVIATSRESGMQLMDSHLMQLYKAGRITLDDAFVKAASKKEFEALMGTQPAAAPAKIAPGRPAGGA